MNKTIEGNTENFLTFIGKLGLNPVEKQLLEENTRDILYEKGETIFKQNSFVSHVVFLNKGLIKLVIEGTNSKKIILKFNTSGEFIGLPAIGHLDAYPFSALACSDAEVSLIKKDTFNQILKTNQNLSEYVIKWYTKDYRFLFKQFEIIGTKNMHGRFAETLLHLAEDKMQKEDVYGFISRKDMADYTGMSMESMVRLLNEFKNDRLITIKSKEIVINDIEMIKRLATIG